MAAATSQRGEACGCRMVGRWTLLSEPRTREQGSSCHIARGIGGIVSLREAPPGSRNKSYTPDAANTPLSWRARGSTHDWRARTGATAVLRRCYGGAAAVLQRRPQRVAMSGPRGHRAAAPATSIQPSRERTPCARPFGARMPPRNAVSSRRLAAPRDARAAPREQRRELIAGPRRASAVRRVTARARRSQPRATATASRRRTSLSPSGAAASDSAPGIERVRARGAAPAGPEPTSTQRRRGTSTPPAARPRQPQGSAERRTTIPVDILRWWSSPAPLLPHRARRKCPRRSVGASKKRADFAARPRANAREAAKTPTWVAAAALGAQDGAAPVRWRQSTRPGNSPEWASHLECPQTVGRISRPGALEESVRSSPDPPARI